MKKNIIEISNLNKNYDGKQVLKNINLNVTEGEIFAVIGPSGAGKTTILRIINMLDKPTSGKIFFNNRDYNNRNRLKTRRKMVLLFQDTGVMSGSVYDNVSYGLKIRGVDKTEIKEKVANALREMGIESYGKRDVKTLSGGEKQRMAFARATVFNPELILLDEPTANLDPKNVGVVEKIIKKINKSNTTIIMSTHRFEEAISLADRIAVICRGEILQVGAPEEIFRKPTSKQVAEFIGLENLFEGVSTIKEGISEIYINKIKVYATSGKEGKVKVVIHPEDVIVSREKIVSSARNTFKGKIVEISDKGVLVKVVVDVGIPIITLVMRRSFEELNLNINSKVYVSFKMSCVHVF
ncbi:MAG: hypothetical protein A7316_01370 [Candidatus Altiarchaeales archaeon WOR_SM1_86-2]|nr:MAG: hypothetical protein A7315_05080 [Candidatus Altiarchaeales archaeon WOR_SM1_79]ODS37968.1 MAG: hypothetical protein A7316_01370 [Candidatus Altiarchaeales archaeon WOR_SM1_86-2]